jgi:hypothetical protein
MFPGKFFVALLALFISLAAISQKQYSKTEMKKNPVWIKMIDDEHVNYFEALKAFELYFTTHKFPTMEEEEMGKNEKLKERIERSEKKYAKKARKRKENPSEPQKEKHEEAKLAFEVKKFNHWEMQTRPYVKDDGSIMSAEERMKIWKESKGQ